MYTNHYNILVYLLILIEGIIIEKNFESIEFMGLVGVLEINSSTLLQIPKHTKKRGALLCSHPGALSQRMIVRV